MIFETNYIFNINLKLGEISGFQENVVEEMFINQY